MDDVDLREQLFDRRLQLTEGLNGLPYDLILYLQRAVIHSDLGYPDLAAGDAYKALLLTDEVCNEGFEYHEKAMESLLMHTGVPIPEVMAYGDLPQDWSPAVVESLGGGEEAARRLAGLASIRAHQILSLSLLLCGCLKSASNFCERGLKLAPKNKELLNAQTHIRTVARRRLRRDNFNTNDLSDYGLVRREVYPWNHHEPDRFAQDSLDALNTHLKTMAPKCAVQVATLPVLLEGASNTDHYDIIPTCKQLGVFAAQDIAPGEDVLREYSLLTANNRLKDPVCDACSADLPPLGSDNEAVNCDECYDTVFCSQYCHDAAQERYHPAVCEKDVDAIAKDPEASEADETLYLLLLSRVLALAAHQNLHPLDVQEVRFIWGDFVPTATNDIDISPNAGPPPEWTLPFSFKYNIETPLHILEKMDIDIYTSLSQYDLWIFNTLYAKFRGTASARKNPRDGRPDVAAVHPYWCLANHDCDPNVTWDWGGRMVLWARKERLVGGRPGGIKKGEEILNHYCDVSLPVQKRREWARGSLGGWCMCKRCRDEASQTNGEPQALADVCMPGC
ncbi:wd and tetratricopeptide repeat protein [Metarhizium album ARSEF 1941]|uniref:Wd and tetratricopeptide repeat protein n=1 Tax=Metarhizium album (strain ARSEF 1941) TaxID=1081103 RepID=A0A0B2WTK3_METAS|nr:wd and tetratricopeptide repeat protein [Metarhizium album ARSEF 1941]KHN96240.1 wd and tetratricopeptide repeat protein [Metarhizium album ARSEF 1941]